MSPTLTFRSRSSFFLIGFYTLSLVCFSLIVKFGILRSINPPSSTLRGMFVLSSFVAGVAGGGFAIFFWQATKYLIGAWGGLAFGLWVQCFRDGGLIRPVGIRWLLFISMWRYSPCERLSLMHCAVCAVIGFVLCTIPKIHYQVLLVATAIVGSTAVILGVDCFTTAGLKEVRLVISSIRIMQMLNFLSSSICGISDTGSSFPSILVTTFSFPSHSLWRLRLVSSGLCG